MEVTLKKAVELQDKIGQRVSALAQEVAQGSTATFTQHTIKNLKSKADDLRQKTDKVGTLNSARFYIRGLVADANARVGVNKVLLQIAECQSLITALSRVEYAYASSDIDTAELDSYFADQVKAMEMHGTPVRPVTVSLIEENVSKDRAKTLELKISNLRDELAALNLTTKVNISQVEQLLKDELLI